MGTDARPGPEDLTETEREAVHEVELGIEQLHRAHGHLVSFHHCTGRAINHLVSAEELLRECGHPSLADRLRDEFLFRGVVDANDEERVAGRWSYDILESFQDDFLTGFVGFGEAVREAVAGGMRHPFERKQELDWKRRARRE